MQIKGRELEFLEDTHTYLVDGIIVPSITQILKYKFGRKYEGIHPEILSEAARKGTETHKAIEDWCKDGTEIDLPELKNFKFLKDRFGFEVLENETPVILEDKKGEVIGAGRLDLVLEMDGQIGGADIKRTATLDREYLAHQLNLYRIAYRQSYGTEWEFLRAVHLRGDTRKFVTIPIREERIWEFLDEWKRNTQTEEKEPEELPCTR